MDLSALAEDIGLLERTLTAYGPGSESREALLDQLFQARHHFRADPSAAHAYGRSTRLWIGLDRIWREEAVREIADPGFVASLAYFVASLCVQVPQNQELAVYVVSQTH